MRPGAHRDGARVSVSIAAQTGGFTLIEALVVTAVLSVLAVGLTLGSGAQSPDDQARFEQRFETAQALAMQGRQTRGFFVTEERLRQAVLTAEGWLPLGEGLRWHGAVGFSADRPSFGSAEERPDIILLPTGQTTVFTIDFAGTGQGSRWCESDGWRGVQCDGR
ncbi:MAG: prepilin-type N-terminal cleavage/methylation domain-containing protein [Rhodobacteraceae bacterium]|nr:prepilin-type N-terminal cleavage/methylation domain-containing protein [Paracoccaceae bacterium]